MADTDELVEPEGVNAGSTEAATSPGDSDRGNAEQASGAGPAGLFDSQGPGVSGEHTAPGPGQDLSAGEG